ncbi:MAG: hypothetical protein JO126_03200 [Alphaproteobacteria bacterium]|nr:hypothetical protein [Alphaproteobacteria bacterium]MBV8548447.1 hypothetical protein [Alphaproteobacteria bacterium]
MYLGSPNARRNAGLHNLRVETAVRILKSLEQALAPLAQVVAPVTQALSRTKQNRGAPVAMAAPGMGLGFGRFGSAQPPEGDPT